MKKLISIILCICLMVIPINVTALDLPDTNTTEITDETIVNGESIETEIIDDSTVTISPNDNSPEAQAIRKILEHKAANGETVETMAQASGLIDGGIYNIKNYFSGKYLNVHYGVDANGTNVYQWTKDGSTEQKFKVVYDSATDSYKIYAMCSSNGNNRVLDVVRNGAALASGQNVDIWTPVDHTAQRLRLTYLIDGLYHIHMLGNKDLYFTTHDSLNGTSGGKSSTSAGNVYIRTFDVDLNQQWLFEYVGTSSSNPATPVGSLASVNKSYIRGWAWRSDLPNTPINVNIQIYRGNTKLVDTTVSANEYSSDLYMSDYGNGYHEFTYYYDWTTIPSATYKIYAYGIASNGSYVSLSNSPMTFSWNNSYTVDCTDSQQQQQTNSWCWAVSALMLGKNVYPGSQVTQEDIVRYVTENYYGSDIEDIGGNSLDIANGAAFASNYNKTFVCDTALSFDEIKTILSHGYLVQAAHDYEPGAQHAMIIYGCSFDWDTTTMQAEQMISYFEPTYNKCHTVKFSEFCNSTIYDMQLGCDVSVAYVSSVYADY